MTSSNKVAEVSDFETLREKASKYSAKQHFIVEDKEVTTIRDIKLSNLRGTTIKRNIANHCCKFDAIFELCCTAANPCLRKHPKE